jgi:hypothetical protein
MKNAATMRLTRILDSVLMGRNCRKPDPNCITQTEGGYLPVLVKVIGGKECCAYCDKEMR